MKGCGKCIMPNRFCGKYYVPKSTLDEISKMSITDIDKKRCLDDCYHQILCMECTLK